ncbi:hypothetical protein [Amycolatopsis sp. SID8362]|uniref:hypothetical protein n=1 Tax=Amycolatopsis sp. SID8362 TaxID=2690346 RepID=UPI00136A8CE0|nr:hypothetical protein [Amycolatopsis sp. SID8362]NBH02035.1 hypothetical protein [Amycolatopsis sp. SID8362]NED38738.1 hypothetical protein [Amycolatopsis sp. SID8362]
MDSGTTTQLITVGATLGGVVLTLLTTTFVESRKLKAAQRAEERKRAADHAGWLRDERVKAYASLSTASEEAFQLVRSEFLQLPENRAEIEARWRERRSELRKAHNQVALLGTEEPRRRGKELWKAARNGVNDVFAELDAGASAVPRESLDRVLSGISDAGDRFLEACRADVQGAG